MVAFDPILIDDQRQRVNGVFLGPVRWHIFALLWKRMDRWVARSSIRQQLPHYMDKEAHPRTIDVHIHYIRKALSGTPYKIEMRYEFGYRMVKP